MDMLTTRRSFLCGSVAFASVGFRSLRVPDSYSIALLGDLHFDAQPESVYHEHYDESNRCAKVQHEEFRRNGEMWRRRCREMIAASGALSKERPTDIVLQLGDLVQGDCDDPVVHRRMLADCMNLLQGYYRGDVPVLTVIGNHDIRGKGALQAYKSFTRAHMSRALGIAFDYPVSAFRYGRDLWIFCDFEIRDLAPLLDVFEREKTARYTFLVTHGPFTTQDNWSFRWRLGGSKECEKLRPKLYEALSRRHAIVLSGHTHEVAWCQHENRFGGFSEFTANSVWERQDQATAKALKEGKEQYGEDLLHLRKGAALADFKSELDFFRPGLKGYFMNHGAGHYRLNVSDQKVVIEFYPGSSMTCQRTFALARWSAQRRT